VPCRGDRDPLITLKYLTLDKSGGFVIYIYFISIALAAVSSSTCGKKRNDKEGW
jgi:hypothetical protein